MKEHIAYFSFPKDIKPKKEEFKHLNILFTKFQLDNCPDPDFTYREFPKIEHLDMQIFDCDMKYITILKFKQYCQKRASDTYFM